MKAMLFNARSTYLDQEFREKKHMSLHKVEIKHGYYFKYLIMLYDKL